MTQHLSMGWGYWSGSCAKKHRAVIVMVSLLLRAGCSLPLAQSRFQTQEEWELNSLSEFRLG